MRAWTFVILRNCYISQMRRNKFTAPYDEGVAEPLQRVLDRRLEGGGGDGHAVDLDDLLHLLDDDLLLDLDDLLLYHSLDLHGAVLRHDALHDGVLARDVHDLARWLFHAFAGPAPIERLAGGLRFEDRLELINLGLVLS